MLLVVSVGEVEVPLRRLLPAGTLFLEFTEGLGGAWTEPDGEYERLLFGYPAGSALPWFRIFDSEPDAHNVATLALERIVFARQVSVVAVVDDRALAPVRRALRVHPSVRPLTPGTGEGREAFLRRLSGQLTRGVNA